jgi:hypothetical protein
MADIMKLRTVLGIVKELAALQEHPTAKPLDHKYPGLFWGQSEWLRPAYPIDFVDFNSGADVLAEVANAPSCGTAMCFAGWTAWVDGYTDVDSSGWMVDRVTGEKLAQQEIEGHAKESLDLDWEWADALFDGSNTLEDIELIISHLTVPVRMG